MRPHERLPHIWPVLLASALGIAILVTLGFWQVERLKWKEELLAQLGANAAAEPIGLAEVEALQAEGRNVEFVKELLYKDCTREQCYKTY